MSWDELIERWVAWMVAGGMSRETIGLRVYHVRRLAEAHGDPAKVTTDDLIDWLSGHDWLPATKRSYRASYRAFWSWAVSTGRLVSSPAADLPRIKVPRSKPRPTPDDVFEFGLTIADPRGWRAIMLGGNCGLRRGEIARSHTDWLERDLVGWSLRVIGKGGHERLVPLPDDLAQHIRALPEGYLFPSSAPGREHLTPAHVGVIVKRYLETHSTHTLRHRAGTKSYHATRDIRAVQEFLGHAKTDTTAIYTEVPASSIRAAMEGARPTRAA